MNQNTSLPTSLYKYLPASTARKFFKNPSLRFTPPSKLNDIFELNAPIEELVYDDKMSALEDYLSSRNITKSEGTFDGFLLLFHANYRVGNLSMNNGMATLMEDIGMGILSLSSINNSLLMWAHYCEDYKGVVVELDVASKFFQSEPSGRHFLPPQKIEYVTDRPRISLLEIAVKEARGEVNRMQMFFKPVFFTKSEDWHYEKEWRVATLDVDSLNTFTDDNGVPIIGLAPLPVEAIKSIIINDKRSDSDLREQVLSFCNDHKITLKLATTSIRKFALNIETVPLPFNFCHS